MNRNIFKETLENAEHELIEIIANLNTVDMDVVQESVIRLHTLRDQFMYTIDIINQSKAAETELRGCLDEIHRIIDNMDEIGSVPYECV